MKEIKINRLTLENFKCHRLLNLALDGQPVSIYGDNATGKTSIYDALTWLLFGKDSMGNGEKNIDIKPLDANGEVRDHQAITSVEAEFLVDGQVQTFQRTYREIWATRRGTGTPAYEGNTSDYFVNGVPCKKNAFDTEIKKMVSEDLFRMLTSVSHFAAGMKWQERRAVLFDMAGTLTDKEIMLKDEKFAPLLDSLGGLTIADFKAKLLHQKKGQTGIQNDTPARINECERTLADIAGINFEEARGQEQALIRQKDGLQVQLLALDQDTVLEKKRLELREAKFERDQLESRNRVHRESQRKNGRDLTYLYNEISREQAAIGQSKNYLAGAQQGISRVEKEIQNCRDEWVEENGKAFAGGKCPTCGQALPFEQLKKATENFNKRKQTRLDAITAKAKSLQDDLEQSQKRNQNIQDEISRREAHIAELNEQIRKAQEEVAPITDLPEYAEEIAAVNGRIDALQAEISSLMADSSKVREQLRADLNAADGQLRFVQGVLAKEAIKAQTEKRIAELNADARNAAEILERIEQMLFLMEEFTRFKAKFVEQSINDHFRIATFRLFREQANGGLEERCDVVYDGVPFMGLNNGMKVNVGIDIINALSRHYGVNVPLFVDNAEAVTRLEPCNSQMIRLVVSEEDMPAALADIVSRLKNNKNMAVAYDQDMMRQALIRDVYDSYWNVSTLYTVADVKQKKINALKSRHAQRMTDLRTKHREKVAELRQEQKDAVAAVRTAERQKAESRTKKALDKYRDNQKQVAANRAERKGKTELRRKIRKTVFELEKLLNRGNKKKNVKDGMSAMVSSSLKLADALFMDEYSNRDMLRNGVGVQLTDAEEKAFKEAQELLQQTESASFLETMEFDSEEAAQDYLKKLDHNLGSKMSALKDVFARERKRLYGTKVSELIGKLAEEYNSLSDAEDGAVRAAKDENVYAHLLQLQKDIKDVTVRDMSLAQLEIVADAYTMVLTTVRNANKMFAKNLKFKRDTLSNMVMGEIGSAVKKISKLVKPGKDLKDSFSWNNLKPVYAFERLGSETLKALYGNIRKGQDIWAVDMQEADDFRREQYKKHNRKAWNLEKQHQFEFESGVVELSLEQIMSLYAYSRREQALDHLLKGGFVFSGSTEVMVKEHGIQRRYLKKDATAYNLTADELLQVIDTLTKEQKAFVEEMQTYLSDVMGGKGNEISLQMYGIKSYGEKNYFPIRSAGQYMERAKEDSFRKEQGQISIVNSGFTKSTTPKANNPITLDGFMNVWAEHVNEMSMYHGFALPMEDFRRVYNYSSPNVEAGNSQSVNAAIENAFGKAATGYIDQLYKDLNGGAVSDNRENLSKKLVGLHKKAAVFASASVVIQQPSAIVRAFAVIDPRHFIGPKVDRKRNKQLWEEVKKYAPVAFVKEMGYFDTGMGRSARDFLQAEEYSGIREKMTALFKDADYRDEILGKAPALADELTWCSIWEAVKRETKAKNPGMDVRSDAFLQIAGARFSEVIDKTQVYDSVLSRSANMRSKSGLMNMVTSFMAEPTTSINMLEDALRKGDRQQLKRTVGAVYGSVLLNSLLVSLVYAARDDDDDETWWEKYLSSVAVEMMDGINPITYYPFLRDIWSIGQGFDVERADMSLISDVADAAKNVISAGMKLRNAEEGEEAAAMEKFKDSLWSMTDTVASLTGLPVKNIRRDIEGARNMMKTIGTDLAGRKTTDLSLLDAVLADVMNSIPIGGLLYRKNKRDRLYGALVAGDAAYVQRLKAGYESDNAYHSAIKQALRENDSRIWEAAVAWNSGDMETYLRIAKEIRGENRFNQDDIVLAIRAEANSMLESDGESASTVKGYFTNEKFGVALSQINTGMADIIRKDLIDTKVANGKTREEAARSVESTARSQLKELFEDGSITGDAAEKLLVRYGGYDQEEAADKVADWKFEAEYGFAYSDRGDAYKNGEISQEELRSMLMDVGGKTREEADLQIQVYDWEAQGFEGATVSAVRNYNEYCAGARVPKDVYLHIRKVSNSTDNDVDASGKTIYYSAMRKIMAEIGAQYSLTATQKHAIARSLGWSEKNIEKYKTW